MFGFVGKPTTAGDLNKNNKVKEKICSVGYG